MAIAADLFYSTDPNQDTLHKRVIPTDQQEEYLQENWRALANYLTGALSSHYGMPSQTWIQGSYKYNTLIRPATINGEYDVDLGVYLLPSSDIHIAHLPSANAYRNYVKNLLETYTNSDEEAERVATPSKQKCERLHYVEDFHIDVPAYVLNKNRHMLSVLTNSWEESDPRGLYLWFKKAAERLDNGGQLRRLIRYIKNWSGQSFANLESDHLPSSIMLTVLVVEAVEANRTNLPSADDDALNIVIQYIYNRMYKNASVSNPIDTSENINRLSSDGYNNFMKALKGFCETAELAVKSPNRFYASRLWEKAFHHFFPIDAESYGDSKLPSRISPEINIDVAESDVGAPFLQGAKNAISNVPKGCWLSFRITNAGSLPMGCSVEWVVRNAGSEALNNNDLGHRSSGSSMFFHKEHTAYTGTHFMDCTVYDSTGNFYSFRRVPVSIINQTRGQILKPKKPSYRSYGKK